MNFAVSLLLIKQAFDFSNNIIRNFWHIRILRSSTIALGVLSIEITIYEFRL